METISDCLGFLTGRIRTSCQSCYSSNYDRVDAEHLLNEPARPRSLPFTALLTTLWPYIWPKNNFGLHVRVVIALVCMLCANFVSFLLPITFKYSVDALSGVDKEPEFPLFWILLYGVCRIGSKFFTNMRDAIFVPVTQHALQKAGTETFAHLHSLGHSYHVGRRTGAVLRAIDRGTEAMSSLLSFILFNICPTFIELFLVLLYFVIALPILFAVVTSITVTMYIIYTLTVTEWRRKFRQQMNEANSSANNKAVDSLLNFETVKYFSNQNHEIERFSKDLQNYSSVALRSSQSLSLLNIGQATIIGVGVTSCMLLAASYVVDGRLTVGEFVLVNTYMIQLYSPLNFLGTAYRIIIQSLVNLEDMFLLFDEAPDVADAPDAQPLEMPIHGEIEFKDVLFGYGDEPIFQNLSFRVDRGSSVAIVGPTGGGKSTIVRLLLRFYDIQGGSISIDGQDLKSIQLESLRKSIAVVPQDTVLFNETVMYNLRYGRLDASDEEIYEAATMAQIHDFIMSLPDKYETRVGERGLRLSGGECQRVSIARALLKDPPIICYDEATSALDTKTEKEIQGALDDASKGRTTLIIAHRLSTVINCDQILVIKNGTIVESGTHKELIELKGEYHEMWERQSHESELKEEEFN